MSRRCRPPQRERWRGWDPAALVPLLVPPARGCPSLNKEPEFLGKRNFNAQCFVLLSPKKLTKRSNPCFWYVERWCVAKMPASTKAEGLAPRTCPQSQRLILPLRMRCNLLVSHGHTLTCFFHKEPTVCDVWHPPELKKAWLNNDFSVTRLSGVTGMALGQIFVALLLRLRAASTRLHQALILAMAPPQPLLSSIIGYTLVSGLLYFAG